MKLNKLIHTLFLIVAMSFSFTAYAETVWIDVRSAFEHSIDNIEGDIRISHDDIVEEVTKLYPDKNTEIHLYCAAGVRAAKALDALTNNGYTNISNAGGIDDARKQRSLSK